MKRGNLFWGFIIIIFGVLLLLNSFSLLQGVNPWKLLWPVFLIGLGLYILFGHFLGGQYKGEMEELAVPLEGATSARVKINHGAGKLVLDSRAGPNELLSGSFGGGIRSDIDRRGSEIQVKLRPHDNAFPFFNWGWSSGLDWNIGLTREVPLALEISTGANEASMDLTDLRVTEVQVHTGASSTKILLPGNAGYTRVTCDGGVAGVVLRVPAGVAARIRYHGGLSSISVDTSRFPHVGSEYRSQDFDIAMNKVDINVQMGIGSIDVR